MDSFSVVTFPVLMSEAGVVNMTYPYGDVRRFGAKVDGVTDDTPALTAALTAVAASGGIVMLPPGVIRGHLHPVGGGPGTAIRIEGAGMGMTFLVPATVNKPVIQKSFTSGTACLGYYVGKFTVMAHSSGGVGAGAAVDMCGFHGSHFEDINYLDNGAGYFEYLFTLSAIRAGMAGGTCYFNTITRARLMSVSAGMKNMIRFENDMQVGVGTVSCSAGVATFSVSQSGAAVNGGYVIVGGVGYIISAFNGTTMCTLSGSPTFGASSFTIGSSGNNANGTTIINPFAYANNNLVAAIDAQRSAATTIIDPFIESNAGAKAIILGTATRVIGGWIEANVANDEVAFQASVDGASNSCVMLNTYFSSAGTITIPSTCRSNILHDVQFVGGKIVVDNGTDNLVETSAAIRGGGVNFARTITNSAAGGGSWQEILGATGGSCGAGTRALYDLTNAQIREIVTPLGPRHFFSGASGSPSVRVVPFDDVTPTAGVFDVTDAAEGVTRMQIMKSGAVNLADTGAVIYKGGVQVVGVRGAAVATVTGTAGMSYTTTEQGMINALVAAVNALNARLNSSTGHGLIT